MVTASATGLVDIEPRTGRRNKAVLCIEERSMNTHVIAQELRERHDPKEARIWAGIIEGLEELRPYLAAEAIGMQWLEHSLLLARLGQRMDAIENRAHSYIVEQSQWISEWSQTAEDPTRG